MDSARTAPQPFALRPQASSLLPRLVAALAAPLVERALGLRSLAQLYAETSGPALDSDFPARAMAQLGIAAPVRDEDLARIPATGPLVVVANHPFGAADGLALLAIVRRVRPDVRLLGNFLLQRLPELAPLVIAVDPFGGREARATNRRMLRRAIDWTCRGGALIVFPAGEVSSSAASNGALVDGPWRPGVARIVADTGATVLPVFFEGRNSRMFAIAGRIHPRLRTLLLPRELLRRRGQTVEATIGAPIPNARIQSLGRPDAVLRYLRARTYGLRHHHTQPTRGTVQTPIAPPAHPADVLAREIGALAPERELLANRAFSVYYASAAEIPATMLEIGRLREVAFRAAGEGSGANRDLDAFDRHYWHLFLWDRAKQAVVGAYRLGPTDVILPALGVRGLYTRTLFTFGRTFVEAMGPALELGRSFVRVEYQREFSPLLLLWQGIGKFIARHPRYRRLFGPVSISASYTGASRDALVDLLHSPALRSPLASQVRARRPYRAATRPARPMVAVDPAEIHALIGDVEPDGKGMPVLLRQYLKLNAKVAAVSVDPDFSNVIDALSIVDLDAVDEATRRKYINC